MWQSFVRNIYTVFLGFLQIILGWLGKSEFKQREKRIKESLKNSSDYKTWEYYALELDRLQGYDKWKEDPKSEYYDSDLIKSRLKILKDLLSSGEIRPLALCLRSGLLRNIGGSGNEELFSHCNIGTKKLIEEYTLTVVKALKFVAEGTFPEFPEDQKLDFFFETRQAYGRSALLLSGGAGLGLYHFGVVKALYETKLLPKVISGSSVGSLVAASVCCQEEKNFSRLFEPGGVHYEAFEKLDGGLWASMSRKFQRLFTKGVLMDIKTLEECVRSNIGDVTFKEAYEKTGRILNITVASTSKFEVPRILNYITAPNVLIYSAACASCALPGLYEPVELLAKDHNNEIHPYHPSRMKWTDGSIENDLPMTRLSELFNVNHFIVSQVNPHVIPFIRGNKRQVSGFSRFVRSLLMSEIKHRMIQFAEIGLTPRVIQPLITQKYEGDITIVADVSAKDYLKVISNPTEEFRIHCTQRGLQSTFPRIRMIQTHCSIEQALDDCVRYVRQRLARTLADELKASMSVEKLSLYELQHGRERSTPNIEDIDVEEDDEGEEVASLINMRRANSFTSSSLLSSAVLLPNI